MKWIFYIILTILVYLIIVSILKVVKTKKNIIESKLGLSICFKRKETIINNFINYLKIKEPDKLRDSSIIKDNNDYLNTKEIERKISLGDNLSRKLEDFISLNYYLKADGEISAFINNLKEIDERILEFNKKYNLSILAYDIVRKKSIIFFIFRKYEKSKDVIEFSDN